MECAVLVYQAGIANVFEVNSFNQADWGREAKRLLQSDFRSCESFARGLVATGVSVRSMACNMAGDIVNQYWDAELDDAPFSSEFRPVNSAICQKCNRDGAMERGLCAECRIIKREVYTV